MMGWRRRRKTKPWPSWVPVAVIVVGALVGLTLNWYRVNRPPGPVAGDVLSRMTMTQDLRWGLGSQRLLVAVLSPRCQVCRDRAAEIATFVQAIRGQGGEVRILVRGSDSEAKQHAAATRLPEEWTLPLGPQLRSTLGIRAYPQFFLCDSSGKVLASTLGVPNAEQKAELIRLLSEVNYHAIDTPSGQGLVAGLA